MRLHARQTEATPAPRVGDDGTTTLALLLAGLAGWVDAIGVGSSNDVFLSFMSGNTTNLALSLTHQDWARAKTIGAAVALFVAGVTFGELVRRWTGRLGQPLVLWLESFLLGAGAAFHWPGIGVQVFNTLWPLVFAMGLQNTSMRRVGGINVGLTYVTGALVQAGRALAGRGGGTAMRSLALWLSLAIGAGLGAISLWISALAALAAAAAAAATLGIIMALVPP